MGRWAVVAILLLSWTAAAQVVPRGVAPGVLSEDARREEERPPSQAPRLRSPPPSQGAAPPGAAQAPFVYRGLRIEGASALDPALLASQWPHQEGEAVSAADIFTFAAAVTRAYREAGYLLSQAVVPAQTVADGTFLIRVVEGYVDEVVVQGEVPDAVRERIRRRLAQVLTERPATLSGIERGLLRAQELPGVVMRGTLSPGEAQGGARLTIDAVYDPFGASVDYANALPRSLGRDLVSVTGEARLMGADVWRLSASASPGRTYRHVSVLARTAVGEAETALAVSGSGTWTRPEGESLLGPVRYRGRSRDVELFADRTVVRSRRESLRTGGGVSMSEYRSRLVGEDGVDRLWTVSARVDYERASGSDGVSGVSGAVSQGLDIWGASGESRHEGSPQFTALELDGRYERRLGGWVGGATAMTVAVRAQVALGPDALLSAAECYYGGQRFGAGFDSGTLSGDHCAMASLGLRWTRGMTLPGGGGAGRLTLHGAVDTGWVGQKGGLEAGERRTASASSGRLGARLALTGGLSVELELARALSLPPGESDPGVRLGAALGYRF